ncbi:MAG: DoxX family membrane protein [Dehalococcoidia bacterium]|nr:DoxX family membrane protein [Dehalococcoidia bacterium]
MAAHRRIAILPAPHERGCDRWRNEMPQETSTRRRVIEAARGTRPARHLVIPRLAAGAPLLVIGLAHVFDDSAPMQPLVEAAGLPAPALLAPAAVAAEVAAGVALLLGAFARAGAALAVVAMLAAIYAHATIDVWPNGADQEPPLALPIVVLLCGAYILWRGAGRWSIDALGARGTSEEWPPVEASTA